jgi:hypothetical protein
MGSSAVNTGRNLSFPGTVKPKGSCAPRLPIALRIRRFPLTDEYTRKEGS